MKTRGGRTRLTLLKELLEGALDDDPASQIVAVGLSRDDARFFAKALKAYLEKGSTLHQAFDLTVKRGAPKSGGKHRELAREAWELKLVGKTWEQVADALGKRFDFRRGQHAGEARPGLDDEVGGFAVVAFQ